MTDPRPLTSADDFYPAKGFFYRVIRFVYRNGQLAERWIHDDFIGLQDAIAQSKTLLADGVQVTVYNHARVPVSTRARNLGIKSSSGRIITVTKLIGLDVEIAPKKGEYKRRR